MKAAHLENEINPFASAFCAPYAWSSRKGHWLRSLPVLLDMSIGRGRLESLIGRSSWQRLQVWTRQADRLRLSRCHKVGRAESLAPRPFAAAAMHGKLNLNTLPHH